MTTIACIGGGPGGLLAAILLKQADPASEICVYDRAEAKSAPGWGIVLPAPACDALRAADAVTMERLGSRCRTWDRIDVHFRGRVVSSQGHDFISLGRETLLQILGERAESLQIKRVFGREIRHVDELRTQHGSPDLIIAADGSRSRIRSSLAGRFDPTQRIGETRFLWLGTTRCTDAFNFVFIETQWGWFQAHVFPLSATSSTFIVETAVDTWHQSGLAAADLATTVRFCENVFQGWLNGASLLAASSLNEPAEPAAARWRRFTHLSNQTLVHDNIALLGDAAHALHFSIGAGTRLAIEDAVALRDAFVAHRPNVTEALTCYESERRTAVLKLQSAARNSTAWFENVGRYADLAPEQFAYSLLTRSQRLGHAELRKRDPLHIRHHEGWLRDQTDSSVTFNDNKTKNSKIAPMFLPFALRALRLANRVVVSPMAMYSAEDGTVGDFHLVHLGTRALGGAGLLITEMTAISPAARITPGCAGLYRPEHVAAWRRITDFVHGQSDTRMCLQLGHAGPKGSTKRGWEGMDDPLENGAWPVLGPSAISWSIKHPLPRVMDAEDMNRIRAQFVSATLNAIDAGFDMVELHAAHGYLLSAFITPLTNKRTDLYGGSLGNRLRFPIEVFQAMRCVWPAERPMSVRISAHDWVEGGITPDESVEIARAFKSEGADLIDVSTGQTSIDAKPVYGRMFQTPFSDRIRNEVGIATMAVGNITEPNHLNTIIAAGRADLCALGRSHLSDPNFTLRAAASEGFEDQTWPKPYLAAKAPFEKMLQPATQPAGI